VGIALFIKVFLALMMLLLIGLLFRYLGRFDSSVAETNQSVRILKSKGVTVEASEGILQWGYLSDTLLLLELSGDFNIRSEENSPAVLWDSPGGLFQLNHGFLEVRQIVGGLEFRLHSGELILDPNTISIVYPRGRTYQILGSEDMVTITRKFD
jgi:hypothetical protein